jgi:hypothetical protein
MEGEWIHVGSLTENKMEIAQLAMFVMVGYARALRCGEIPKLEITGLLKHYVIVSRKVQAGRWGEATFSTCGGGNGVRTAYLRLGTASSGAEGEKWANAGFLISM